MDQVDFQEIISSCEQKTLDKNEVLFERGESIKGLYIIINGTIVEEYQQRVVPKKDSSSGSQEFEVRVNSQSIELSENTLDLVWLIRRSKGTWGLFLGRRRF
jgi:signal-transduction protein with cAMP-binding, CBS, and nucleotidyltransferase domain